LLGTSKNPLRTCVLRLLSGERKTSSRQRLEQLPRVYRGSLLCFYFSLVFQTEKIDFAKTIILKTLHLIMAVKRDH